MSVYVYRENTQILCSSVDETQQYVQHASQSHMELLPQKFLINVNYTSLLFNWVIGALFLIEHSPTFQSFVLYTF